MFKILSFSLSCIAAFTYVPSASAAVHMLSSGGMDPLHITDTTALHVGDEVVYRVGGLASESRMTVRVVSEGPEGVRLQTAYILDGANMVQDVLLDKTDGHVLQQKMVYGDADTTDEMDEDPADETPGAGDTQGDINASLLFAQKVVETRRERITVAAGTFDAIYERVVMVFDEGQEMPWQERWTSVDIPVTGLVKSIEETGFGPSITTELMLITRG